MLQGNVVVARELARRYGDQGIVSTSVNPGKACGCPFLHIPPLSSFHAVGNIKSGLQRNISPLIRPLIVRPALHFALHFPTCGLLTSEL